ncbi:MAG TPA: hemolysin III family protein [Candidatus Pygmaiobacter gallistercoris]|nr:hemolysin III family protein [Candidatus Pygmaiobacter gallistercoris]
MSELFRSAQDPISSESHAFGAFLSLVGGFLLILRGFEVGASVCDLAGSFLFVLSLIALYAASAIYHYYPGTAASGGIKRRLRKLDHSMIYLLIAGSYTPFSLKFLPAEKGMRFCGILWLIALFGILLKLLWINAPRMLTSLLYLCMGWAILFVIDDFASCGPLCLGLVALGGIFYTVGAVIYALKRPNFSSRFGFHELFHLFILAGSITHYLAVFFFVL